MKRLGLAAAAAVLVGAVTGCQPTQGLANMVAPKFPAASVRSSGCHYRGSGLLVLPDPACTPGALNTAVTQATVRATICRSGYTRTIRPSVQVSSALKTKALAAYGLPASAAATTELDHLVPLELGGDPASVANLWPEPNYPGGPHPTSYDHNPKDPQEFALRNAVCAGRVSLLVAQKAMESDWRQAGRLAGHS